MTMTEHHPLRDELRAIRRSRSREALRYVVIAGLLLSPAVASIGWLLLR